MSGAYPAGRDIACWKPQSVSWTSALECLMYPNMVVTLKKKPEPAFIIRLAGPRIRPWAIPLRSLTTVLQAVQRLVDQRDEFIDDMQEGGDVQADSGIVLHLLNVKSGSAAYAVAAPEHDDTLSVLRLFRQCIDQPEHVDWLDSTLSSVKEISAVARSLDCEIEFRKAEKSRVYGGVIAKITPTTFAEIEGSAYINARTSVYARIERVGGAIEMHCGIRLPGAPRKMVICRVKTAELVRELGQYMYQYVILIGQATWLRHNWRLKRILIDAFEPPKVGSIKEALRKSHQAGGCAWDAVEDPERLIAEMRGA